jgi:rare lipoprotein A
VPTLVRSILLACALLAALPLAASAEPVTGGTQAPLSPARAQTVEAGGVQLSVRPEHLRGRLVRFRGRLARAQAERGVTVERFVVATSSWKPVASATPEADGTFSAHWRANRLGVLRFRAVIGSGAVAAAGAVPEVAVTVHRPALATWFGPGLYGNRTACGQTMSPLLHGVAHRTLACGTRVRLLHAGRTLTVPVVDRGPFRAGTEWDLTTATAQALGFTATGEIGALRLTGAPAAQASR